MANLHLRLPLIVPLCLLSLANSYTTVASTRVCEDVAFSYFNGSNSLVHNETIALAMQTYLTLFAITGDPNRLGTLAFPQYGPDAKIPDLNSMSNTTIHNPTDHPRCRWRQQAFYHWTHKQPWTRWNGVVCNFSFPPRHGVMFHITPGTEA
jgi:hypothetical protein